MYRFQDKEKLEIIDNKSEFDALIEEGEDVLRRAYWNFGSRLSLLGLGGLTLLIVASNSDNNIYKSAIALGYAAVCYIAFPRLLKYHGEISKLEDAVNEIRVMKLEIKSS